MEMTLVQAVVAGGQGRIGKFSIPNGGRKLTLNIGGRGGNGSSGGNASGGSGGSSPVSSWWKRW